MRKVSMATRAELILAIKGLYASAGRPEKAKILGEFVALTGFHRKHAMRLLRGSDEPAKGGARPGRRIYGDAVRIALVSPQPCRGYIRPDGLMVPLSSWLPLLSNGYHAGQSVIDTRLSLAQIGEAHAYR